MIAGITRGNDRSRERLEGLRQALARHGLTLCERATCEIPYSIRAARRALAELDANGALPTALVCGNDVIALGVMLEALERNKRIPADLSVTGFDRVVPIGATVEQAYAAISIDEVPEPVG